MADAYVYYVCICGIPDDVFWDSDPSFLSALVANKSAYERWQTAKEQAERKEANRGK